MEKLIFHPLDEGFYAAEVPKGLFSERMIVTFGIAKTLKLYGETEWNIFLDRFKNLPIAEAKMLRPLLSNSEICYDDTINILFRPRIIRASHSRTRRAKLAMMILSQVSSRKGLL